MTGWRLFICGAALVMAVVYPLYVGRWLRGMPMVRTCVKSVGGLIAAVIAVCGAMHTPDRAAWMVVTGIVVCTVADAVIVSSLFAGTAVFLLGHLFYLGSFLYLAPFSAHSLIPFALISPTMLAIQSTRRHAVKNSSIYMLYGAVLLLTLTTSLLLPSRIGPRGVTAAAGMLMFVASDCLIATRIFVQNSIRRDAVIMGLYYAALLLLSLVALQPWAW